VGRRWATRTRARIERPDQIAPRVAVAAPPIIPNAVPDVSPSLRILIVEDHEDLADALRANLRSEGYQASVASDGRQALAMVRADPPDIVVLDLGIPGLDGLALLSRLRAEGHWCPVLILSARDSDSDKVEGFRLGADDYVTKPFRTLELMARVDAMGRRVVRERAAASLPPAPAPPVPTPDVSLLTAERIMGACGLTLRQAEIALLIAEGRSNPEIAERLGISRFTARNHAEHILARLKVESRWQVARALCDVVAAGAGARDGSSGSPAV
jgi:DNA-binding response OmpR family regulator